MWNGLKMTAKTADTARYLRNGDGEDSRAGCTRSISRSRIYASSQARADREIADGAME